MGKNLEGIICNFKTIIGTSLHHTLLEVCTIIIILAKDYCYTQGLLSKIQRHKKIQKG